MWDWLSNWSSNPTSILAAIAVIALIWRVGRWTQRIENGLQTLGERIDAQGTSLGERIDAQGTSLGERIDAQGTSLGERIDTGLKTLRDEVRQQESETRRTLDILLLRVAGSAQTAAGNSPLKLTEFGKRIEASLNPAEWIAATAEELRPKTEGLEPLQGVVDDGGHPLVVIGSRPAGAEFIVQPFQAALPIPSAPPADGGGAHAQACGDGCVRRADGACEHDLRSLDQAARERPRPTDPGQFGLRLLAEFDGRDRTTSWHRGTSCEMHPLCL